MVGYEHSMVLRIRGLKKFVNLKFEVIDLETNDPITGYKEGKNAYEWGMDYYENLKTKVLSCSIQ